MEYERIHNHKVETGIISPSKLRMKLLGRPHNSPKKGGSNSDSARTSPTPSKLNHSDSVGNSLLKNGDLDDQALTLELASEKGAGDVVLGPSLRPEETLPRKNTDVGRVKLQQFSKGDSGDSSEIHPMRLLQEDDNLDYDSNASSSGFEFHKEERSMQNHMARSFSRSTQNHIPSKWNDAEKWIVNRQNGQANYSKKIPLHTQANRSAAANMVRVVPEYATYDQKPSIVRAAETKRVDFCQTASHSSDKFSFVPSRDHDIGNGNALEGLEGLRRTGLACAKSSSSDVSVVPATRSVCMRDMGTEMTPVVSQEPSRTATPVGATTPLWSPASSIPSTPRGEAPASTPMEQTRNDESQRPLETNNRELSEQEIKEKTRKEIMSLGVRLGKMNIAAWASKDGEIKNTCSVELERIELAKRAAAWEEAEKSKHTARYKSEEIKIQAWESRQRAKLEAEVRRVEAEVEQVRARAQAMMFRKMAVARQLSEAKRCAAEARKTRYAERTAAQAEYIRQTGRMPPSHFTCCAGCYWLS